MLGVLKHVFTFLIEALFPFSSVVATVEISGTVSRLECQQQCTLLRNPNPRCGKLNLQNMESTGTAFSYICELFVTL